jgi:hypothetical protein
MVQIAKVKAQPDQESQKVTKISGVLIPDVFLTRKKILFNVQLDSVSGPVKDIYMKRYGALINQEVIVSGRDDKLNALYVAFNEKEYFIDWTMKGVFKITDPETKREYVSGPAQDGGVNSFHFQDYPSLRIDEILSLADVIMKKEKKSEDADITENAAKAIEDIGLQAYPVLKKRLEEGSINKRHRKIAEAALKRLQSTNQLGKDGGTVGGIDLRALPIGLQTEPAAISMVVPGTDTGKRTAEELDSTWTEIEKSIQSGPMPYEQLKAHAIACCQNKDAKRAREKLSSCIAGLLKLEEEAAIPTAPELKEILLVLS